MIENKSEIKTLREIEKDAISTTLKVNFGNKRQTARMLGLGLSTLYTKINEYGILA